MRKILRRIAALERSLAGRQEQDEAIVERALQRLSLPEMELLLLASVADREGRRLTEAQMAAKQAYHLALRTQCLGAWRPSTVGFVDTPALRRIMVAANLRRLSFEDLQFVHRGVQGLNEGRPLSGDETAALQVCQKEWERLCEMAGVSSTNVGQANSSDSLSAAEVQTRG